MNLLRVEEHAHDSRILVERVMLCFGGRVDTGIVEPFEVAPAAIRRIGVPFRSQRSAAPALASRTCSPTAVAMLLAYRGVDVATSAVAARVFDREHDIYGNWNRAVQGAFTFGVPGYHARLRDWNEVAQLVAAGQPLVISIAAAPRELDGAPYARTDGNPPVLTGFGARGEVCVSDPAAAVAVRGRTLYRRVQLQRAWLERGGTAYVLLPAVR